MKKGRNFFDPFMSFDVAPEQRNAPASEVLKASVDVAPEQRNAPASEVLKASVLPHRLGFLDCRRVIPGVAAGDFARA
jgi:hypothetical protein